MDCFCRINDILNVITVFTGQHTNLINVRFDQCRACFNSHFKKFSTCIKDYRFAGFLYDLYKSLVCCSVKSFRHTTGHGYNVCIFYQFSEFLFESGKIFFCQCKSRLQKFCLHMIYLIPDIDAGPALCIHMIKITFDAEWFQRIFNIVSCMAAHKSGGNNLCPVNGCRFGYIQTFTAGNIRTFPDTVDFACFKIIYHISFVDCGIQCHCQYHFHSSSFDKRIFPFTSPGVLNNWNASCA